jgi:hypothetical protein
LKLGIVAGTQRGAAGRGVIDASGLSGDVDVTPVRNSIGDLETVMRRLAAALRAGNGDLESISLELRVDLNAVRVLLPEDTPLTPPERAFVAKAERLYRTLIRTGTYRGHPVAQACSYPFCTPPLRAGIKVGLSYTLEGIYYPGFYDGLCTGGFIVRGRWPDTNVYQLTAGHCVDGGVYSGTWGTRPGSETTPWRPIGDWQEGYRGQLGDAGKYKVNDGQYWSWRAWVARAESEAYPIYGDADPVQGQTVCISGAYTPGNCGLIAAARAYAYFEGWMYFVRATYCARGGDSGAPVYASNLALGVHMGVYEYECNAVFTAIRDAENMMNVDVRTTPICTAFERSRLKTGDMNGDGRADIYRFTDPGDRIGAGYVWRSNGTSFTSLGQVNTGFGIAYQDRIADLDGDGDDDVLQFSDDGRVDGWRSNRTSYTQLSQITRNHGSSCESRIADINGDGRDDVLSFTNDGYGYGFLSGGAGYEFLGIIGTGFGSAYQDRVADIDGDGDDDILQILDNGNAYAWLADSTHIRYAGGALIATGLGSSNEVRVGDRDGDGDADLYRFSDAGNGYYWRSNRSSYTYVGQFTSGFGPSRQVRIADINGDRKADILEFSDEGAGYAWLGDGTGYGSIIYIGTGFGAP